jgi:hypothetical protein
MAKHCEALWKDAEKLATDAEKPAALRWIP